MAQTKTQGGTGRRVAVGDVASEGGHHISNANTSTTGISKVNVPHREGSHTPGRGDPSQVGNFGLPNPHKKTMDQGGNLGGSGSWTSSVRVVTIGTCTLC